MAYKEIGKYGLFKGKNKSSETVLSGINSISSLSKILNHCLKDTQRTKGRCVQSFMLTKWNYQ